MKYKVFVFQSLDPFLAFQGSKSSKKGSQQDLKHKVFVSQALDPFLAFQGSKSSKKGSKQSLHVAEMAIMMSS